MAESVAAKKKRAARIVKGLARAYPDAKCALRYRTPFQLLVATILSAQCTDKKVNEVTAVLFREHGTAAKLAAANPATIEAIVRPTGFYRQKAKSIQSAARDIVEAHGGKVPNTMDGLLTLRGVARKTANVVLGNAFGVPGLTIDTHMKRIHQRLGLTGEDDPVKIERDLMALIPEPVWTTYSHQVITHGRECCDARRPQCEACPIAIDCPWPRQAAAKGKTIAAGARRPTAKRSGKARARRTPTPTKAGHP